MTEVSVSILPLFADKKFDASEVEMYLQRVSNADYVHIDVMDGKFVPEKTIWTEEVKKIKNTKTDLVKHVHLMVENPENCIEEFADAGDIVTFHAEATKKPEKVIEKIKNRAKVGIALNAETPFSKIKKYIPEVDLILIMPIHPGKGGQKFQESALEKIRQVREIRDDIDIEIDGGIDDKTGEKCVAAGANILCSGSYIYNFEDPKIAIDILRNV